MTDEVVEDAWACYFKRRSRGDYDRVAMRAALEAVAPMLVPDGWKLVPIELTNEMFDAGLDEMGTWRDWTDGGCMVETYKKMLAAAPTPPNTTRPND